MLYFTPITLGVPKPPSIVATDKDIDNTASTTHTFSGKSVGVADPTRLIIVPIEAATSSSSISCTINGNAATSVSGAALDSGSSHVRMFVLAVPTGTTANIVVTLGSAGSASIGIFAAYNLLSFTPTDANSDISGTLDLSVSVSALGVACGFAFCNATGTWSWSGLTKQYDNAVGSLTESGAIYTAMASQSPLSVSASFSGSGINIGCSASFR